ncbi:6-bladed beta-propeller [Bacillus sp. FJAT-27445]|uniref:6-bladed beta-propeller n=1 Tax=Bacillus sp. FJAT-27445 TaxID=1679166 RepID=UPI000743E2E3|nr:6-bladed beta-propeller [Bacillus sp. FJAT-27445]
MKKKTLYKLMGSIVILSLILFGAIYYLGLQYNVEKMTKVVDQNGPPIFTQLIHGDFSNPLDKPMDAARIGEFLYVTDTNHKQVQVFDLSGTSVFRFGKEGESEGQFMFPYGISGDKKENVYVADLYTGKISIFDSKGKFLKYFEEQGQKNKVIEAPAGLRIINEKLYVTDIKKSKLFVFTLDGKKEMEIATGANPEDKLAAPNAVALDAENIYISDSGNQRVIKYDLKGKYVATINGSKDGKGNSTFVNPRGVGVDERGILYVVNNLASSVSGFDSEGTQIFEIGSMGDGNEQFYLPNGLSIDQNGTIFITDTVNQRIAVYN